MDNNKALAALYSDALASVQNPINTTTDGETTLRRVKIAAVALIAWPTLHGLSSLLGWIAGML